MTYTNQKDTSIRELDSFEMSLTSGGGWSRELIKDVAYGAGFSARRGGTAAAFAIGFSLARGM